MFCYSEGKTEKTQYRVPYHRMNATKGYLEHFNNYLYLTFILTNERSTPAEKRQANLEIIIANRKLEWWWRHPNLNKNAVNAGKRELRQKWGVK
jgi:hypothetical protein